MSQFYAEQSERINDTIRSLNARDFDSLEQLKEVYNDNILTKSAEKIQDFTDKWTNIENLAEKEIIGVASFGGIVKGGKSLLSTIKAIKAARQTRATGGNVGEDLAEDSLDVDDGPKPEDFEPSEEDISRGDDEADFDPTEDDIADASKSAVKDTTTDAVEDTTTDATEDMFSTSSFSTPATVEDTVDQASGFTRDLDFENAMENLDPTTMSTEDLQSAYDEFDSYLDERDRATTPRETPPEDDGNADVDNFSSETEGAQNDVSESATDNFSAEQTAENTAEDTLETGGDTVGSTVADTVADTVGSTVGKIGAQVAGEEVAGQLGGEVGGEIGGSIVGELVGGLSLSAIPVVGEVVAIVGGIAAAATAIAELFEKPKRATVTAPDPSISNLDLQSQLSSKYSNAAPSMDSLDKVGGNSTF